MYTYMFGKPLLNETREQWESPSLQAGSCSMQGVRDENEDRHVVVPKLGCMHDKAFSLYGHQEVALMAVFDGHNGSACAEFCSRQIEERVSNLEDPFDTKLLTAMFLQMDHDFLQIDPKKHAQSGSTGIVVLVRPPDKRCPMYTVLTAHVGDSRAMSVSTSAEYKKHRVVTLSTDHKPEDPLEYRRIRKAKGFVSAGRVCGQLAMSRAFGDDPYKTDSKRSALEQQVIAAPTFTTSVVEPGDLLVVCCDGPLERMTNENLGAKCLEALSSALDAPSADPSFFCGQRALARQERKLGRFVSPDGLRAKWSNLPIKDKVRLIRDDYGRVGGGGGDDHHHHYHHRSTPYLDLGKVAARVCRESIEMGSTDNQSLILVRCKYENEDAKHALAPAPAPYMSVYEPEVLPSACWRNLSHSFLGKYIAETLAYRPRGHDDTNDPGARWTLSKLLDHNQVWTAPPKDRAALMNVLGSMIKKIGGDSKVSDYLRAVTDLIWGLPLTKALESKTISSESSSESSTDSADDELDGSESEDNEEPTEDHVSVLMDGQDAAPPPEADDEVDSGDDTDVVENTEEPATFNVASRKRVRTTDNDQDVCEPKSKRPRLTKVVPATNNKAMTKPRLATAKLKRILVRGGAGLTVRSKRGLGLL